MEIFTILESMISKNKFSKQISKLTMRNLSLTIDAEFEHVRWSMRLSLSLSYFFFQISMQEIFFYIKLSKFKIKLSYPIKFEWMEIITILESMFSKNKF